MALSRIATALRPAVRRTCAHFHTAAPHFTARATAPAFNDAADAADAAVAERAAQLAQLFDDPMSLHALDKAFGKAADAERENQKERKVDDGERRGVDLKVPEDASHRDLSDAALRFGPASRRAPRRDSCSAIIITSPVLSVVNIGKEEVTTTFSKKSRATEKSVQQTKTQIRFHPT